MPTVWAQEQTASSQGTQSQGRSDADIQSDVAYALSHSKSLQGQHITAATVEGDVTVSGYVHDEASKELAETVITGVKGVRSVSNNLTVGNAPQTNTANALPADSNAAPQQDPNYDPAQQNMAPGGGQDQGQNQQQSQGENQAQGAPMPEQQGNMPTPPSNDPQYSAPRQPYPQQPYSQQPYGQQQAYGQQNYPPQAQQPLTPVTIPPGTLFQIRTSEPLDATRVQVGQVFQATVASDIYQGGVLALPRGAVITGKVLGTATNKGDLVGKQGMVLGLTSISLGGQSYLLPVENWSQLGPGKGGYSAANTVGTAGLGAIIGAIAGGGAGAAIGAGAGALVGAGASAATTGPRLFIPAEAVLNFHLTAPLTVTPVSAQEAQRLASSAYPQMQRRGPYPYGAYPPPPPPPGYYYPYRYPVVYPSYYYGYRY